jgi:hypothetical protein
LLNADQKGLSAEDYDGSRWNDRLAKLKPKSQQPTEADAVKFDLALTVCAMRYISDLHIGKVNPRQFAFAYNDESKKYDLAEFLKDHVVDGGDVRFKLCKRISCLRGKMMGNGSRSRKKRLYLAIPIPASHDSCDCSGWSATFRLMPMFRQIKPSTKVLWWTL